MGIEVSRKLCPQCPLLPDFMFFFSKLLDLRDYQYLKYFLQFLIFYIYIYIYAYIYFYTYISSFFVVWIIHHWRSSQPLRADSRLRPPAKSILRNEWLQCNSVALAHETATVTFLGVSVCFLRNSRGVSVDYTWRIQHSYCGVIVCLCVGVFILTTIIMFTFS